MFSIPLNVTEYFPVLIIDLLKFYEYYWILKVLIITEISVRFIEYYNQGVNPGQKVAIVGKEGCDKSTAIDLL